MVSYPSSTSTSSCIYYNMLFFGQTNHKISYFIYKNKLVSMEWLCMVYKFVVYNYTFKVLFLYQSLVQFCQFTQSSYKWRHTVLTTSMLIWLFWILRKAAGNMLKVGREVRPALNNLFNRKSWENDIPTSLRVFLTSDYLAQWDFCCARLRESSAWAEHCPACSINWARFR